jgi:hypothetical protein
LLILSFGGALEAPQGIFYAGGELFRAKRFHEPTPPAWREDEVSAILDAAARCVDGSAGDVRLHLQAQWKNSMQAELMSFGIDLFDLEEEVPGAAKGFARKGDGLAYAGRTFWLNAFRVKGTIKPLGIAFPLHEVLPDHLNRCFDHGGGANG